MLTHGASGSCCPTRSGTCGWRGCHECLADVLSCHLVLGILCWAAWPLRNEAPEVRDVMKIFFDAWYPGRWEELVEAPDNGAEVGQAAKGQGLVLIQLCREKMMMLEKGLPWMSILWKLRRRRTMQMGLRLWLSLRLLGTSYCLLHSGRNLLKYREEWGALARTLQS